MLEILVKLVVSTVVMFLELPLEAFGHEIQGGKIIIKGAILKGTTENTQ